MPAPAFPALHSVLDPAALSAWLAGSFGCAPPEVTFLRRGLNDTYRVDGLPAGGAILRVYRCGWRTPADAAWEDALTLRAASAGVGAARVIPHPDGARVLTLNAPEGPRLAALFGRVEGREPQPTQEDAARFGRAAAALHAAGEGLPAAGRFALDLAHLIDGPVARVLPLLAGEPELAREIQAAAGRTRAALEALEGQLTRVSCHGDLHGGNALVDGGGELHLFDFDCGGPGFAAYDLAVYGWDHALNSAPDDDTPWTVWAAFLEAYRAARPLTAADGAALGPFGVARALWFMGLYADLTGTWGSQLAGRRFFRSGLASIGRWEARHAVSSSAATSRAVSG
ncbi:phosphotransferase enzyme family protein [Deinococcus aquaticus]|uniref:Phosphotransferase n=1 Tax=Deinococcus aquaticus TaxID=328692 RepID=A0ABY7V5N4_9DEIO|nr:phosphotransferase [Deinococcus aquaticus]WDA59197.1 phosphotransferase [Deinococcus aquaticus]